MTATVAVIATLAVLVAVLFIIGKHQSSAWSQCCMHLQYITTNLEQYSSVLLDAGGSHFTYMLCTCCVLAHQVNLFPC